MNLPHSQRTDRAGTASGAGRRRRRGRAPGVRYQLSALAVAVWRRPQNPRKGNFTQHAAVPDCGRHGARFPRRGVAGSYDLQIPMSMTKPFMGMERDGKGWSWLQIMGRLKPGVSMQRAQASIDSLARSLDSGGPQFAAYFLADGRQGFGGVRKQFQNPGVILMALCGLVLLVACSDSADLLRSNAAERPHESPILLPFGR